MPVIMSRLFAGIVLIAVTLLSGCASVGGPAGPSGDGTVVRIAERTEASGAGRAVGAVGGAVVGSILGGQFGGGFGRTVAATTGAVGGSIAGSSLGGRVGQHLVWDLTIRFEDGIERTLTVKERPAVRSGDRVSVREGQVTRR